jgi:hypothetical protein
MKTIKEFVLILITAVILCLTFVAWQGFFAVHFPVKLYEYVKTQYIVYFLGAVGSMTAALIFLPITIFSSRKKYFPLVTSVFAIFLIVFIQKDIAYSYYVNYLEYLVLIIFSLAFGYVGNRLCRK